MPPEPPFSQDPASIRMAKEVAKKLFGFASHATSDEAGRAMSDAGCSMEDVIIGIRSLNRPGASEEKVQGIAQILYGVANKISQNPEWFGSPDEQRMLKVQINAIMTSIGRETGIRVSSVARANPNSL
ncbi:MAG: hypothetical protein KGJ06_05315 [Pseudomonadota bacterium]|nr:hypothetical protein [Pseudomonadota bacterium]